MEDEELYVIPECYHKWVGKEYIFEKLEFRITKIIHKNS